MRNAPFANCIDAIKMIYDLGYAGQYLNKPEQVQVVYNLVFPNKKFDKNNLDRIFKSLMNYANRYCSLIQYFNEHSEREWVRYRVLLVDLDSTPTGYNLAEMKETYEALYGKPTDLSKREDVYLEIMKYYLINHTEDIALLGYFNSVQHNRRLYDIWRERFFTPNN